VQEINVIEITDESIAIEWEALEGAIGYQLFIEQEGLGENDISKKCITFCTVFITQYYTVSCVLMMSL